MGFNFAIDGVIGPRTRAAVVAFERKRRLPLTGELDEEMAELLVAQAFPK